MLDLIERKAKGEEIVVEAPPEQPKKVPDLMAALEASIAAQQPGGRKASEKSSDGAKPNDPDRARSLLGDPLWRLLIGPGAPAHPGRVRGRGAPPGVHVN